MKKICCLLLAALPMAAQAYQIEVERQLNGAEVSVNTQKIDHNMAGLMLYNYGAQTASCAVLARSGPETPRNRKAVIAPGDSANFNLTFKRSVLKLRIKVTCELQ